MKITKIEKPCIECGKTFLAATKELARGNAKFCGLSCASRHNNRQNSLHQKTFRCRWCAVEFQNLQSTSQYCSHRCKQRSAQFKRKRDNNPEIRLLSRFPCEICGWDKATRDLHHITPIRAAGANVISNLISLCPNCHRCADRNLISQEQLLKAVNNRTISSSEELASELGANVVIKKTELPH